MRLAFAAGALCLSLVGVAGQQTTSSAPESAPALADSSAAALSSDAAAKHAKRTACLKDAKSKKLVGAEKTGFLKDCIAAP
jgi:hypothetical protein